MYNPIISTSQSIHPQLRLEGRSYSSGGIVFGSRSRRSMRLVNRDPGTALDRCTYKPNPVPRRRLDSATQRVMANQCLTHQLQLARGLRQQTAVHGTRATCHAPAHAAAAYRLPELRGCSRRQHPGITCQSVAAPAPAVVSSNGASPTLRLEMPGKSQEQVRLARYGRGGGCCNFVVLGSGAFIGAFISSKGLQ